MRKASLFLATVFCAALVSCNKENPTDTAVPAGGKTYTLSVNASKLATKALEEAGKNINATWGASDVVKVCKNGSATAIGTLTPLTTGSADASLTGTVTLTGVSVGDKLDLIFPRETWSYEGQTGTLAGIAENFDYATATVTVSAINGENLKTSDAEFVNQQAIVKFTIFDSSENSLRDVKSLTISAASGKLVKSYAVSDDSYTPVYGDIVVTPSSATSEFYVALRNNSAAADTYTLTAKFDNFTNYTYVKSGVTFANGQYRAINVKMTQETDIYTVAGSPIEVFGSSWNQDDSANDMVKQADGTYRKTYQLTGTEIGPIAFKVVKNRDWSYAWPSSDYTIDDVTKGTLVITFDPSSEKVNAYIESDAYTIAGDDQSLFGASWEPSETANDMVKQDDGTFLKNYTIPSSLVGINIQFKVAKDHKFDESWGKDGGSDNYTYEIPHTGTLHISFDPTSHDIDAWMDDIRYSIAGTFNVWDISANPMIKQANGTYKSEVSVPAGYPTIEYKVVHAETDWIGDPNNGGENFSKEVPVECDLIFTYNPATGLVKMDYRINNGVEDVLRTVLNKAETGTIIEMKAGTYIESNSNYIAFAGKEITVQAVPGAEVTIQPQVPITISGGGQAKFVDIIFDASHLMDLATWYEHLIYASDNNANNRLVLESCEIKNFNMNKSVIYCSSSNKFASVVLNNCYFHDIMKSVFFSEGASVDAFTMTNSTIANITTESSSYYAGVIDPRGASVAVTVDHCTFYNCQTMNTDYGAVKVKDSSNAVISNCIFMMPDTYSYGRAVYNSYGEVKNCLTFNYTKDSTPHGIHSGPTITNCIEDDPLFVNPVNSDFSLGTGSPALTASETNGPIGDPRWYN